MIFNLTAQTVTYRTPTGLRTWLPSGTVAFVEAAYGPLTDSETFSYVTLESTIVRNVPGPWSGALYLVDFDVLLAVETAHRHSVHLLAPDMGMSAEWRDGRAIVTRFIRGTRY